MATDISAFFGEEINRILQSTMRNGDFEFHELTGPLLDTIASEGLRIARDNSWRGLVIDIVSNRKPFSAIAGIVRCTLRNTAEEHEIDEPSACLLEAAQRLQDVFTSVGTPLAGATIDWVDENRDGKVRQRCRYRYD